MINKCYGRYASFFKSHELKEADEYIKRVFPNAGVIRLDDGRYRYLTERECWRLQGYTDEDFDNAARVNPGKEGCMNSALYKQAGNSIPVPIFESIFRKIILNQTDSSNNENRLF